MLSSLLPSSSSTSSSSAAALSLWRVSVAPLLWWSLLMTVLVVVIPTTTAAAASKDPDDDTTTTTTCDVYVSVSSTSTKDELIWGLYAGRDFDPREVLGSPDLAINVHHWKVHLGLDGPDSEDTDAQSLLRQSVEFAESFLWVPDSAGGKYELKDGGRTVTIIPGVGVLSGMNTKLTNAQWNHTLPYFRPLVGETPGRVHPGRGAYTPFYNVGISARTTIAQGSEIFMSYGENYEEEEKKEELSREDYQKLDETIDQMIAFFDKHRDELDEDAQMQIYSFLSRDVMNAAVGPDRQRKISKILPPRPDQLASIKEKGGSMFFDSPNVHRDIAWLRKHAFCGDHLQYGASTIPNAGRGAFAKRPLAAGATVAPVPLIQIPDKAVFDTYPLQPSMPATFRRTSNEAESAQLALNYVYSHPESSLAFLPTGPGVNFINHHHTEANVKLVWSSHPSNTRDWFEDDPEDLVDDDHLQIGLLMEIVALREIAAGEEILLDYGADFQAAWDAHVAQWEQAVAQTSAELEPWPTRATDINHEYQTQPFRTEDELVDNPYPASVVLMGFIMIKESTKPGTLERPKEWDVPGSGTVFDSDNLFHIVVVDRVALDQLYNYTIRWENNHGEYTFVEHVPHSALTFVDRPETGDSFVPNAFRHYIGIPDDVFPQGPWRNLVVEEE